MSDLESLPDGLIEDVRERLSAGQRLRRTLPGGGRLHIDRRLPFLVVHRRPVDREDAGTDQLVTSQAAYLLAPGSAAFAAALGELVATVAEVLSEEFGAFLVVEVWTAPEAAEKARDPLVRIVTPDQQAELKAVDELAAGLEGMTLEYWQPDIRPARAKSATPPGMPPLVVPAEANRLNCYIVGIELDPVFRAPGGTVYPELARELARQLSPALQRGFFAFSREKTSAQPSAWQGLGRREMVGAVRRVDAAFGEISDRFDFLLAVTPVDATEAWRQFEASGFRETPSFRYRPMANDPELLLRDLYAAPLEDVEDPTLDRIFREKLREIARQLTMLAERNTHRFLPGSLQLYGGVEPELLRLAEELLAVIGPAGLEAGEPASDPTIDATELARLARQEFDLYREQYAEFDAELDLRDDVAGLMVSRNTLLIDRRLTVTATRARALLHHEVGTHILTWMNGRSQPLQMFRVGLAGYEVLQEGLAVLGEYLSGGLTRERLRLLAARVIAVDRLLNEATFVDIFDELTTDHGLGAYLSFMATMRVTRGGGLTKDTIYLRGFQQVAKYLRDGGDPAVPFIGKIALGHLPLVEELLHRGVLREPPLRPSFLDLPGGAERLAGLRDSTSIVELFDRSQ